MLALRTDAKVQVTQEPSPASDLEAHAQSKRSILCAVCSAAITSPDHRMAMHGAHEHRFMNPAGVLFRIGCFSHAIGCTIVGPDSLEYPWFAGFAWRFSMCGACGQHLGWHFRKPAHDGFFGLILDRLVLPAADG